MCYDDDDQPTGECVGCGEPVYDGDDICQVCADWADELEEELDGDG